MQALRVSHGQWVVQHLDITCDGCEAEPIEGERFKCTVCEDIDLCARCTRALVAARVKMAAEAGGRLSVAPPIEQVPRPRRWVAKLHSKDASAKWAALQTAVPCLSHRFARVDSGPERQVVFVGPGSPAPAGTSKGGSTAAAAAAAEHAGAGDAGAESGAAEVESKLQEFLQDFLPSATSCEDLAWICVSAPQQRHQQQQAGQQREQQQAVQRQEEQQAGPQDQPRAARAAGQPEAAAAAPSSAGAEQAAAALQQVQLKALEERVDAAVEEFEQLVAQRPPTAEDVDGLARKHAIVKAKWLIFPRQDEVDAAWAAVARAVAAGGLCGSAKVSSVSPQDGGRHVLCVYINAYQDQADVDRVKQVLQQILPPLADRRMLLKPDVFTHFQIYSGNKWGLKPTVQQARLPGPA